MVSACRPPWTPSVSCVCVHQITRARRWTRYRAVHCRPSEEANPWPALAPLDETICVVVRVSVQSAFPPTSFMPSNIGTDPCTLGNSTANASKGRSGTASRAVCKSVVGWFRGFRCVFSPAGQRLDAAT